MLSFQNSWLKANIKIHRQRRLKKTPNMEVPDTLLCDWIDKYKCPRKMYPEDTFSWEILFYRTGYTVYPRTRCHPCKINHCAIFTPPWNLHSDLTSLASIVKL